MKLKQFLLVVAISAMTATGSVWIYGKYAPKNGTLLVQSADGKVPINYAGYFDNVAPAGEPVDFTKAANASVPAVVHIKTKIAAKKINNQLPRSRSGGMDDLLEQFFNFGPQIQP